MIKWGGRRDPMVVGFTAISCTIHGKIACVKQVNFQWNDDEVHFVLEQYAQLDSYSASSLKQQSVDRHVTPLGHEPTIYRTRGEHANHYTTNAVGLKGEDTQLNTLFISWEGMGWF